MKTNLISTSNRYILKLLFQGSQELPVPLTSPISIVEQSKFFPSTLLYNYGTRRQFNASTFRLGTVWYPSPAIQSEAFEEAQTGSRKAFTRPKVLDMSTNRHHQGHSYKAAEQQEHKCSEHPIATGGIPSWTSEIAIQLQTVLPTLIGMLLTRVPWMISFRFLGNFCSTEEFAAASFANSIANNTGLAFPFALTSALSTLTSQGKGDLNKRIRERVSDKIEGIEMGKTVKQKESRLLLAHTDIDNIEDGLASPSSFEQQTQEATPKRLTPMVYLYRGLYVNLLFVLSTSLWWMVGMRSTLVALQQDKAMIKLILPYLHILIPGLWGISIQWTVSCWLQAIGLAYFIPWFGVIALLLHVPVNYLLMEMFGWGYYGNAWATVINHHTASNASTVYVDLWTRGSRAKHGYFHLWTNLYIQARTQSCCIHGNHSVPKTGFTLDCRCQSMVAGELATVLAGNLPQPELGLSSMAIFMILNDMNFQLPFSWATAATMRIGNALGANRPDEAKHAATVSVACGVAMTTAIALAIFVGPWTFLPSLFVPESDDLIGMMSQTIPWLVLYNIGDAFACTCNGIMKGCGRQLAELPAVVVAYWVIGIPVSRRGWTNNWISMWDCLAWVDLVDGCDLLYQLETRGRTGVGTGTKVDCVARRSILPHDGAAVVLVNMKAIEYIHRSGNGTLHADRQFSTICCSSLLISRTTT